MYFLKELMVIFLYFFLNVKKSKKHLNNSCLFFPDYIPLFTKRRGNFHGILLNGMVEYEPPMTYFPDDFANKAEFFSENQTYDMTEVVDGYFIDSLHSIERVYNFSTKLYKRRDGGWGMPQKLVYGGYRPTGMLQNLYEGSAEFVWAPLSGNIYS